MTSRLPSSVANNLPSIPKIDLFHTAHKPPPEQKNTTSGETRWFNDWKWHLPWSGKITLDESRAVLPPLALRPVVYTFYDPGKKSKRGKAVLEAEDRLLLLWRRAWWAAGFTPKVLGRAEAQGNQLYESIQRQKLNEAVEREAVRWLAWGQMGTGILTNWLTLPMGDWDNELLAFLRRGDYPPKLIKYEGLGSGLFVGNKEAINKALKQVLFDPKLNASETLLQAMPKDFFTTDIASSVAFYDSKTVASTYKAVHEQLKKDEATGLSMLEALMTSHLHTTWQNRFSSGVAVLKPLPEHSTALIATAIDLARNLTQCSWTPIPSSCPPNIPGCKPCVASRPLPIATPPYFRNSTRTLFTIGTVPHPLTMTSLHYQQPKLSAKFVRRLGLNTRDQWLTTVTKELLGDGVGGESRIVRFKEAVSGTWGAQRSIWLTAERESHKDLEWVFGFAIPRDDNSFKPHTSETPVPGPERRPPAPKQDGTETKGEVLQKEVGLLNSCREALKSKVRQQIQLREAIESWNMADTEVWRFARAWSARRRIERQKWEEEEGSYGGGEGGKGNGKGRWW